MKYIDLSTSIFRERQYVSLFSMEIITLDLIKSVCIICVLFIYVFHGYLKQFEELHVLKQSNFVK